MAVDPEALKSFSDKSLANHVGSYMEPPAGVSDRTRCARYIGQIDLLTQMMSGDWDKPADGYSSEFQEFLSRVTANATRQNFISPDGATAQ